MYDTYRYKSKLTGNINQDIFKNLKREYNFIIIDRFPCTCLLNNSILKVNKSKQDDIVNTKETCERNKHRDQIIAIV